MGQVSIGFSASVGRNGWLEGGVALDQGLETRGGFSLKVNIEAMIL